MSNSSQNMIWCGNLGHFADTIVQNDKQYRIRGEIIYDLGFEWWSKYEQWAFEEGVFI